MEKIDYLGYWVTKEGVFVRHEHFKKLKNASGRSNTKELQELIGLFPFLSLLSDKVIAVLLCSRLLLIQKLKFDNTPDFEDAFKRSKQLFDGRSVSYYDYNKIHELCSDSSQGSNKTLDGKCDFSMLCDFR